MSMSEVDDENKVYSISPFGLLSTQLHKDDAKVAEDALVLYMLRHAPKSGAKGIVCENGRLQFVDLVLGEPS